MRKVLQNRIKRTLQTGVLVFMASMLYGSAVFAAQPPESVSDNAVPSVSENGVPEEEITVVEPEETQEAAVEPIAEEAPAADDSTQLQTMNYSQGVLTDWPQIIEALKTLTPDALSNANQDSSVLVLQLQNVKNIPAEMKDGLAAAEGSGCTKVLQCNLGYGVAMVFNGAENNGGFTGIDNTNLTVTSEKRGKKSMAVTIRFESHQNLGTVASLQTNLPQCAKGTKISVYAETITTDEQGNVSVGENVCIGNTKADEYGNVEVPIQSTANYMFVYKTAKE